MSMNKIENLFNPRILRQFIKSERNGGLKLPDNALETIKTWVAKLPELERLNESQVEQTFNSQIFGHVLGYCQPGEHGPVTLMPKPSMPKNSNSTGRARMTQISHWGNSISRKGMSVGQLSVK